MGQSVFTEERGVKRPNILELCLLNLSKLQEGNIGKGVLTNRGITNSSDIADELSKYIIL